MRTKSSASCWPASIARPAPRLAVALLIALAGCGGGARAATPPSPATAPSSLTALAGTWQWSRAGASGRAWVVERERWTLSAAADRLTGHYDREVTVLSPDGAPFACSQAPRYVLRSRYTLRGEADRGGEARLVEVGYQVEPSPCEGAHRRLAGYRVERSAAGLVLRWPGGAQTLRPAADLAVPSPVARRRLDGDYVWQTRSHDPRRGTRVEREEWHLTEAADGAVRGRYRRRVTAFHPDGAPLTCDGALAHDVVDTIELSGLRIGDRVSLAETGGELAVHPCHGTARTLDAAVGTVTPGHLELEWRGQRRQVLHRVP
jgi:hypothetical protein